MKQIEKIRKLQKENKLLKKQRDNAYKEGLLQNRFDFEVTMKFYKNQKAVSELIRLKKYFAKFDKNEMVYDIIADYSDIISYIDRRIKYLER